MFVVRPQGTTPSPPNGRAMTLFSPRIFFEDGRILYGRQGHDPTGDAPLLKAIGIELGVRPEKVGGLENGLESLENSLMSLENSLKRFRSSQVDWSMKSPENHLMATTDFLEKGRTEQGGRAEEGDRPLASSHAR